jgi:hypothetical protein
MLKEDVLRASLVVFSTKHIRASCNTQVNRRTDLTLLDWKYYISGRRGEYKERRGDCVTHDQQPNDVGPLL